MAGIPVPDDAAVSSPYDTVLAVYNARADILSTVKAQQQFSKAKTTPIAPPIKGNGSIILTLLASQTSAQPVVTRPTSLGSGGNPPQTQAQPPTLGAITTLRLNIALNATDGFAQTVSEHIEARQTIHQTAGGFYVDSYGMKPGELSIEIISVFLDDDIAGSIQVFKNLLFLANLSSTPLSPTAPPRLRYINSVDGRTLYLAQASLDVTQNAANPRMATINLRGAILSDQSEVAKHGGAGATTVQSPLAANVPGGNSAPLGGAGASASTTGVLVDAPTSVAGTAAFA